MGEGPYKNLVDKYKIKMIDLEPDVDPSDRFRIVQIKFDGWFCIMEVNDFNAKIITSGGEVRQEFPIHNIRSARILCEWIVGTNWAINSSVQNHFIAHDVVSWLGDNLETSGYWYRYSLLPMVKERMDKSSIPFMYVESFPSREWKELWNDFILGRYYEGLVFKDDLVPFNESYVGRMKPVVSEDYVIMGFKEGKNRLTGTLGAIEGGLYVNGELKRICTVGGGFTDAMRNEIWRDKDSLMGRVFEARGKAKFPSGALRHPEFYRWREDKQPKDCKL